MDKQRTLDIFIADDDFDDRSIFRTSFSEADAVKITEYPDGTDLMDAIREKPVPPPPDLIFLDINMPKKSGLDCLREIRDHEQFCNVPVIIFTVSSAVNDIDESFACGANLYIRKPYSYSESAATLTRIINDFRDNGHKLDQYPRDKYLVE